MIPPVGLIETIPIVRGDIKVFWIRTARNKNSERTVCHGEPQYTSAFKTRFPNVQKSCLRQQRLLTNRDSNLGRLSTKCTIV
jgi:hypothetical protein